MKNSLIETHKNILENWLKFQLSIQLSIPENSLDINRPLIEYGLDSIDAVTLIANMEEALNQNVPSTLFFDRPTIAKCIDFLASNYDISSLNKASSNFPEIEELEETIAFVKPGE